MDSSLYEKTGVKYNGHQLDLTLFSYEGERRYISLLKTQTLHLVITVDGISPVRSTVDSFWVT